MIPIISMDSFRGWMDIFSYISTYLSRPIKEILPLPLKGFIGRYVKKIVVRFVTCSPSSVS